MRNAFLSGPHVYLRPLEREDAPFFVAWLNDPQVTRTLLLYRPISLQAEEQFIATANQREHDLVLGIALREDDRLIGGTGLRDINAKDRHAGFGIVIGAKEEWKKGYGTEATRLIVGHAFETLNLNRVWLHVHSFNAAGIRAYEKVGFQREGVLRQEVFREGRYWDTIAMSILREEWGATADAKR
jgi:RimJ/RimL family protein N-acetyltransferase